MHSAAIYEVQKAIIAERLRASSSINQHRVSRPKRRFAWAIVRGRSRGNLELRELAAAEGLNR